MLLNRGYDNAVRDILEYGYYYNKDNERIELEASQGEK